MLRINDLNIVGKKAVMAYSTIVAHYLQELKVVGYSVRNFEVAALCVG
jgi:hypothetical protein